MATRNAGLGGGGNSRPRIRRQADDAADGATRGKPSRNAQTGNSQNTGQALNIGFAEAMRAHRGKLAYGPGPGDEVFAASFLSRREIVFDRALLAHAPDFIAVFAHEIYHFVWRRLSNFDRDSWSLLLVNERRPRHLAMSSRVAFDRHRPAPSPKRWKHYACEAFCDTAAALAVAAPGISTQRRRWFRHLNQQRKLPV